MKEIVFIRHAQSQANADGVWNGQAEGPLSEEGEASLDLLGKRLSEWEFDLVVSSPLSRARRTAEAFADDVRIMDDLVEIDLGRWEGMEFAEVAERHADELAQVLNSRTHPMGDTGESLTDLANRATAAVDAVFDSLGEDQKAAVVTHGGFLQAVLRPHLPGESRRVHAFTANTALNRIVLHWERKRMASFNDTGHLAPRPVTVEQHLSEREPVLALIRHGQTRANVEGRWQGHGDWDLDELGRAQAEALAEWYGKWSTVYSSPLRRARSTAERVARNGVVSIEGLEEIAMGKWEGMTTVEILEGWPDLMESIYRHGVDLRRGETGESWGELTERFSGTIAGLETSDTEPTVVVTHGGAIRSYISQLTDTSDAYAESLFTPTNTAVTHVALTERGPEVLDYGVAVHLESAQ